jgi:hypothetical protein
MNTRREDVRELAEEERCLVGEDATLIGPKPDGHEVLVLARREMSHPIDASADAPQPARADMVNQKLGRIARTGGLVSRKEAFLSRSHFIKAVPVWVWLDGRHAHNLSHI